MTKNPFLNALGAAAYITIVATLIFNGQKLFGKGGDTVITMISMISLFTLSAAMMGFFFIFKPIQMYLDGQKKEAVNLFVQTVGSFAVITLVFFCILYLRAR